MSSYEGKSEGGSSTISQPKGNIQCSVYAACAATQFVRGTEINPATVATAVGSRLGGNTDKAFVQVMGYGLTKASTYKSSWSSLITRAMSASWNVPVCLGVEWKIGKSSGNHWIYVVGRDPGTVYARDQQNGHRRISISTSTWKGNADEKAAWSCQVNQIGLGFESREQGMNFLK